eukprot:SAG31_NODE_2419_length_5727_cov_4.235963_5_plen_69_part_00
MCACAGGGGGYREWLHCHIGNCGVGGGGVPGEARHVCTLAEPAKERAGAASGARGGGAPGLPSHAGGG